MSCELGEMRRRRRPPSPAAAPPLEDDDLLAEILLRLPPLPSSLPRASAVCKSWRSLASDPGFSRRFRRHHRRNPPLLGFFMRFGNELRFEPTLDPPNRAPLARFSFPVDPRDSKFMLLGCRHGFLLMLHKSHGSLKLLVLDPINGHEHPIAIPPGFDEKVPVNGAVLRAAVGDMPNFQVVLVSTDVEQRVIACVYSSETGEWGNLITTPIPPNSGSRIDTCKPAVLIGDSIYTLLHGESESMVEFDVDCQSLVVIPLPVESCAGLYDRYSFMWAEGGGLGLLLVSATSDCSLELWKRKPNCDGATSWVLGRTVEIDNLLSLDVQNGLVLRIRGFAEENNVVLLWAFSSFFTVQLDSLQFKKHPRINTHCWHPFEGVYAAGI